MFRVNIKKTGSMQQFIGTLQICLYGISFVSNRIIFGQDKKANAKLHKIIWNNGDQIIAQ